MKLLVFGGAGQVGTAIRESAETGPVSIMAPSRGECDITARTDVQRVLDATEPQGIVNVAAWTDVDAAEHSPEPVTAVNAMAPGLLAGECATRGLPLLHLSTDYVFDGMKDEPYTEQDSPNPINVYGASKLAGEEAIRRSLASHIILRVASIFGPHGRNFYTTMKELLRTREAVSVVANQSSNPTPAEAIAHAILHMSRSMTHEAFTGWGTYHYGGQPAVSWYGFARAIQGALGTDCEIRPVPANEFPATARRPYQSSLDPSQVEGAFGISAPRWGDYLTRLAAR